MFKYNTDIKIKTSNGWELFRGIQKLEKIGKIKIQTNKHSLSCAPTHRVLTERGFIQADLLRNDDVILTSYGKESIFHIEYQTKNPHTFYDIVGVESQQYITNDIVSHNCEFLGSTNTLIDPLVLARIPIRNPIEIRGNDLNIYETPKKNGNYFCMVDTAHGVGGDFSSAVVVDASSVPYKVAATYRNNKIAPLMFPTMIATIGRYFNDAMILVETNDIGQQVVDILRNELEYENILFTKHMAAKGIVISAGFGGSSVIPGVRMTKAVKRIGCANLKTLVETDKLLINDFNILHELSVFVDNGTSYEAENGHHDDAVMCLVMFGWLTHQSFFKEMTNIDIRNNLYDENLKLLEEELTPFGIIDDGYDYSSDDGVSPLWLER